MVPPKSKNTDEGTRASVVPTLGGNYLIDAGNSIKSMSIKGELWFPSVGSPLNPVARNPENMDRFVDGFTEYLSLRWYLIRYRDYTMTKNSRMDIPSIPMNASPEVVELYKKASKLVKNKTGALYDSIQMIVHDYDMDDHFYCRVSKFSSSQSDSKYIAIDYDISLECYQRYNMQSGMTVQMKRTPQEQIDISNGMLQSNSLSSQIADQNIFMVSR